MTFMEQHVKGIIHPEMKIVIYLSSSIVPNLYVFVLLNTKEDILKNVGNTFFY